jgi:hypothetical protein
MQQFFQSIDLFDKPFQFECARISLETVFTLLDLRFKLSDVLFSWSARAPLVIMDALRVCKLLKRQRATVYVTTVDEWYLCIYLLACHARPRKGTLVRALLVHAESRYTVLLRLGIQGDH